MAGKKKTTAAAPVGGDEAEGTRGGKRKLLVIGVAVLVLAGGGYTMLGTGGGDAAAASAEPTTATTVPGPVVPLSPITLNMSDGRYLKVGIALQLASDFEGREPAEDADPTKGYARALDTAIEILGGRSFEQLVSTEGREQAKADLAASLAASYPGEIEGIYFTEFVMQ